MTDESYKKLAKLTLSQLILFNGRRPTEVEQLLVEDYWTQTKEKRPVQDEVAKALTISERVAMDRLDMVMVRGKRGRGVPILLTSNAKESLEMLTMEDKVDPEEETEEESKEDSEEESDPSKESSQSNSDSDDNEPPPPKKGLNTKNGKSYNRWRKDQEDFLLSQPEVKKLLKRKAAPGKLIRELLKKRSKGLLEDKTWTDIKNKIHNINMKEKMQLQKKESQKRVRKR